ncbi:MAG: hypothetical protein A2666_01195 [Parcubacteria group bacterium RIFCSPHIGHO2_01_FULL_47_10b]|nr:MAG: hypothetical protein A2666_01195 [Parcubacteria group bacterium RIFCSPHIGHO2_01_FULL_47_10b]
MTIKILLRLFSLNKFTERFKNRQEIAFLKKTMRRRSKSHSYSLLEAKRVFENRASSKKLMPKH